MEFDPVVSRKSAAGWTRDKQVGFLQHLAATGSVVESAAMVGMSERSAYYLRGRVDAAGFRDAWDKALLIAGGTLLSVAFDRAVHGSPREVWRDGELIAEERQPNDRLLMWLINHVAVRTGSTEARANAEVPRLAHQLAGLHDAALTEFDIEEARELREFEALRLKQQ